MKKRFIGAISLFAMMFGIVSQLPLAWVAPHVISNAMGPNVSYSGTVWNGYVRGIDFVGNANFKLKAKALFSSELPLSFQTSSSVMKLSGKASRSWIKDLKFSGQLARLPTTDGRLKELSGEINVQVLELNYDDKCISVKGQASTDFLQRNRQRWQWQGPFLKGPMSCDNGDLIVKLAGAENGQNIQANLRIAVEGAYRADFVVQTSEVAAGVVLPLFGFEKRGREFHLTEQGKWR